MSNYSAEITYVKDNENLLSELAVKYGSDKGFTSNESKSRFPWGSHTYTDFYSMLLDHCKDNVLNVFECGIGTNNEDVASNMTSNGRPGASLRMWRDYFKNAYIYGADIDDRVLFEEERISTYQLDQTSKESINNLWNTIDVKFDLFIDDGLHHFYAGKELYENSIEKVRKDGIYIIEDILQQDIDSYISYFNSIDVAYSVIKLNGPDIYNDNVLIFIRKK